VSECGCVYSGDSGETSDFDTRSTVRARKPHRCGECRETIPVGAAYERTSGKWDGRMLSLVTCATCAEIRGHLFCDGWSYGCIWEDIRESWRNGNRVAACINACESVAAKEKLASEWRREMEIEPL
jgi:hypothetical protein